jgi:hypothetical protein
MKAHLIFMALVMTTSRPIFSHADTDNQRQSATISVSDTRETYVFTASYDRSATNKVEKFINRNISPGHMGSSENDLIDASTTLADHTSFHIKESAGNLEISIKKNENSQASVERIRKLCNGVKALITKQN